MADLVKTDISGMEPAGRVVPLYKGDYSNTASYQILDVVLYNNSSYIARQATTGNPPPMAQSSNAYWQLIAKGIIDADVSDATVEFTQATTRINIQSGEDGKTLFGKIKKWFADLKTVAFTASYTDLTNQPQSLKNPNSLTFTGAVTGSYDGSAAKSVAIPSVGNGTLTIQKNGTNVQTFTANQSGDATANITVPTSAADVGAVAASKVLTTEEQVFANTDTTNVAGATAVKAMVSQINSKLPSFNRIPLTLVAENLAGYGISSPAIDCMVYGHICLINFWFGLKSSLGAWESRKVATGAPVPRGSDISYSCCPVISDGSGDVQVTIDYSGNLLVNSQVQAATANWLMGTLVYFIP